MKRLIAITALAAAVLAACGGEDQAPASQAPVADPVVTIADMEFQNGTVTIEEGTTVTWVWEDAPMEHDVVFDSFQSPLQAEGTFSHTFDEAGTYEYHCTPHPFMKGTITVVAADPA